MHPLIEQHREGILQLAHAHKVESVRLFGSCARGDDTAARDVDFLVNPGAGGFDLGGFLMDVQGLLRRKIDIVTERSLHPPDSGACHTRGATVMNTKPDVVYVQALRDAMGSEGQ